MSELPRLWDLLKKATGTSVDFEQWKQSIDRRSQLELQSDRLAAVLNRNGIQATAENKICLVGAITGATRITTNYRAICFLPSVAATKRARMLRDLSGFLENDPAGGFCRYLVVTNGRPVALTELRDSMSTLNRKISKWAFEAKERYGVDVIFRGNEFPIKEGSTAHLHANILYMVRRKLPPEKWSEFLSWTHDYFGTVLKDSGRLRNVREVVKYPFKPTDLDNCSDSDICELYRQTFRARIFDVLGSFREWRKGMNEAGHRTVWHEGKVILCKKPERERVERDQDSISKTNRLAGILPPMALFTQFKEPVLVIQGSPEIVFGNDESLRETCLEFRGWWDDNGGPDVRFNLDNSALSVQREKVKNRPPPDQIPIFPHLLDVGT